MKPEHYVCTNCGRKTEDSEIHTQLPDGRCASAALSWYKTAVDEYKPYAKFIGIYNARPESIPRAGGL